MKGSDRVIDRFVDLPQYLGLDQAFLVNAIEQGIKSQFDGVYFVLVEILLGEVIFGFGIGTVEVGNAADEVLVGEVGEVFVGQGIKVVVLSEFS